MAFDILRLIIRVIPTVASLGSLLLLQSLRSLHHRFTYRAVENPKIIVVIGGSFTGIQATMRLSQTLPTGYRVVMVERNSHLNYLFNFPRYSVIKGHEHTAFIPYDGIINKAPKGIIEVVQDTAVSIADHSVKLASGREILYEYLVLATGSKHPAPSKLIATEKSLACAELRSWQDKVAGAERIAVVGGGAVGVEIATDIKSYFPEKEVTLAHSRLQLMPRFGIRLHEHVLSVLKEIGVETRLGTRPEIVQGQNEKTGLRLGNGEVEVFDLVIPCTGQLPDSSLLQAFAPEEVAETTGSINVEKTLQIHGHGNIFAIGDVANTNGPKMARAGFFQAETVVSNILSLIKTGEAITTYKPTEMEGAIKLTLGKDKSLMYMVDGPDNDILIPARGMGDTLQVKQAWRMHGCKLLDCEKEI